MEGREKLWPIYPIDLCFLVYPVHFSLGLTCARGQRLAPMSLTDLRKLKWCDVTGRGDGQCAGLSLGRCCEL